MFKVLPTLLFILLSIPHTTIGQGMTPPPAYYRNVAIADSLMDINKYQDATIHYTMAFKAFQWFGTPDDRYKAARAWGLTGNLDSLNKVLTYLCNKSRYWNYHKFSNDTAFSILKGTPRFDEIIACMKENKKKEAPSVNIEFYNMLDTIYITDQQYRIAVSIAESSKEVDTAVENRLWEEMEKADAINTQKITVFLDKYGWLGPDEVGQRGNKTLFLVIQHAEPAIQEKYYPMMKKAVSEKKALPEDLALLEDRISVDKHGYQIYGSQLTQDPISHTLHLFPIQDEVNVNKRRKSVGLEPLEDYVKRFHLTYTPVTGK
jgi:hypothetical protein